MRPSRTFQPAPSYDFDLYDDAFIRDPFPRYAAMRALGPVVWLPRHRNYAVTHYRETRQVLQNWRLFSSASGVAADDAGCRFLKGNTLASDPPLHDTMRIAMGQPLLPAALADIRKLIDDAAERLLDDLVERRTFDGVADFARFLPLTVVTHLVGLPEDGRENMLNWAAASFDILGVQNERGQRGIETVKEMRQWIATQATPERLRPKSWTARIHELVRRGEISADICPQLIRDYINPSLDTTISATGQLIYQLGRNPDQWRLLRDNPALISNAVDEAVRLASPIRSFSRTVTADTMLAGTALPAGARLMVLFASANRDERKFKEPDRFDVTRSGFEHVGFGHGIHMCVGMHLARLEMEALLHALVRRVDTIAVGTPVVALNNTIHGFVSLPVTIKPAMSIRHPASRPVATQAATSSWIDTEIAWTERRTADVIVVDLVGSPEQPLPEFSAGAHIDVEIAPGLVRQYSLCGDPNDKGSYQIAVLRVKASRGGSVGMHERLKAGSRLRIRKPRNFFKLDETASSTLLFAAGIGVTPIMAMAHRLHFLQRRFVLHYSCKIRDQAAFLGELERSDFADRVRLHVSDEGSRLDIDQAFSQAGRDAHVYICGPARFTDALLARARTLGWADRQLHIERFGPAPIADGEPFTVVAERSGKVLEIPRGKSILTVLEGAGISVASSCQSGVCATCLIDVLEGEPDHRDLVQTAEEKASNRRIAVCCSRSRSRQLVLDV